MRAPCLPSRISSTTTTTTTHGPSNSINWLTRPPGRCFHGHGRINLHAKRKWLSFAAEDPSPRRVHVSLEVYRLTRLSWVRASMYWRGSCWLDHEQSDLLQLEVNTKESRTQPWFQGMNMVNLLQADFCNCPYGNQKKITSSDYNFISVKHGLSLFLVPS